ncbi:MAG: pyridoxamine 5'-phosphate oxidase family protein [Chloroflexota bacterium]|nr:pyridoxamine 5'-phosphate oxidase family protein [Chloroflexota bacterium]
MSTETPQGTLALLNDSVAQELLRSTIPARLAYTWYDGTPRVVPIWFHWTGDEVGLGGPPDAPKVKAIEERPAVALTIDSNGWPHKVLMIRGAAAVTFVDGVISEYALAARRYFGEEQGRARVDQVGSLVTEMARIAVRPAWVGIIDFETRFPSALAKRMA